MAKAQANAPEGLDLKEIDKEVERRAAKARQEKQQFNDKFREAYSFCLPQRIKPSMAGASSQETRPDDATENFSSLGEEVCTDFASDMADTFIPEHTNWAKVEVADTIPEELESDAAEAAKQDTDATFAAIRASNFHEAGKQGFKDLAISAMGIAVTDPGAGEPFRCQVIPIGELLILRDVFGNVGTRFWERNMAAGDIRDTFPGLTLPTAVANALDRRADKKFTVIQGCYRDYSKRAEVAWILFTKIDKETVEASRHIGIGAANIQVARWDPDPNFTWGNGCALKAAADFRELDETNYLKLKGLARQVDPSIAYDDDSVINLDGGLPNGVAIPRLKGSTIDVIESKHDLQAPMFAVQVVEDRIRRHFYQDGPEQKGKTPPTAVQWADESLQKQRRLGTPAAPLWNEFISESYMRFRHLLVLRGELQDRLPVGKKDFPVRPINPLQRAAQQQEAISSERVLATLGGTFGPQLLPIIVDVGETCHRMVKLFDAPGVKLNDAATINDAIKTNQQALIAQQGAAAVAPLLKGAQG